MHLVFAIFALFCLSFNSCKTPSSGSSAVATGSIEATVMDEATMASVFKQYLDVKDYPDPVKQFAKALRTDPNEGTLSRADLRRLYETRDQVEPGRVSKFDRYVAHEFMVLTNYIAWKIRSGQTLKLG